MNYTCKSCHAPVWWAESENGKRMPVNPEPVEDGNVVVLRPGHGLAPPVVRVLGPGEMLLDEPDRFVSDFATCSRADEWRRSR